MISGERADGANTASYPALTMNTVVATALGDKEPLCAFRVAWRPISSISASGSRRSRV
jgi:hypothetical protein